MVAAVPSQLVRRRLLGRHRRTGGGPLGRRSLRLGGLRGRRPVRRRRVGLVPRGRRGDTRDRRGTAARRGARASSRSTELPRNRVATTRLPHHRTSCPRGSCGTRRLRPGPDRVRLGGRARRPRGRPARRAGVGGRPTTGVPVRTVSGSVGAAGCARSRGRPTLACGRRRTGTLDRGRRRGHGVPLDRRRLLRRRRPGRHGRRTAAAAPTAAARREPDDDRRPCPHTGRRLPTSPEHVHGHGGSLSSRTRMRECSLPRSRASATNSGGSLSIGHGCRRCSRRDSPGVVVRGPVLEGQPGSARLPPVRHGGRPSMGGRSASAREGGVASEGGSAFGRLRGRGSPAPRQAPTLAAGTALVPGRACGATRRARSGTRRGTGGPVRGRGRRATAAAPAVVAPAAGGIADVVPEPAADVGGSTRLGTVSDSRRRSRASGAGPGPRSGPRPRRSCRSPHAARRDRRRIPAALADRSGGFMVTSSGPPQRITPTSASPGRRTAAPRGTP